MSHHHLNLKSCSGAAHQKRTVHRGVRHSDARQNSPARQRARIIARLLAASRAAPVDPVASALLLDGALSLMLDYWASSAGLHTGGGAEALCAVEAHAPAVSWRLRLALQAPSPEARLVHAWALLDLLTSPTETISRMAPSLERKSPSPNRLRSQSRKDDQSHVS